MRSNRQMPSDPRGTWTAQQTAKTRRALVGGILALLLAGCLASGGGDAAPVDDPADEPDQAATGGGGSSGDGGGDGERRIGLLASVGGSGRAFEGGIDLFNEQHEGDLQIDAELIAFESLQDRHLNQFLGGTADTDVMAMESNWLPAVAHYLTDLGEYAEADGMDLVEMYGEAAVESVTVEGRIVGLPVRFGTDVLFVRQDLLDAHGLEVPTTREEYRAAAQVLGEDGDLFGVSLKAQSPQWTSESFGRFFVGGGGRWLTDDLSGPHESLRSDYAAETMQFMVDFIGDDVMPSPLSWTYDDNVTAFQTGQLAMSDEDAIRASLLEDPDASEVVGQMTYVPWIQEALGPEPPVQRGATWNMTMDANSEDPDAAWAAIKYLAGLDAQRHMAMEWDNVPTLLEVLEEPEYAEVNPAAGAVQQILAEDGWISYFPVPQQAELVQIAHREIQRAYSGQQTPEEAVNAIYDGFEDAMS